MILNKSDIPQYSLLELALLTLLGYCGNGNERVDLLGSKYHDVQLLVNDLYNGAYPKPSYHDNVDFDIIEKTKEALMKLKPSESDYDNYVNEIINYLKGCDIQ